MGREVFSVAVSDQGRLAASLAALVGQPPIAGCAPLLSVLHSDPAAGLSLAPVAASSDLREDTILASVLPKLRWMRNLAANRQELLVGTLASASGIAREEAVAFFHLRSLFLAAVELYYRHWLDVEYTEFAQFAEANEPVWRAAADECGRARIEAERARREQAEQQERARQEQAALQAALDAWRATMKEQRTALLEHATRDKRDYFGQSEDWFVCLGIEAGDQRREEVRKEQQRKSEEWIRGYQGTNTSAAAPFSSTTGRYQQPPPPPQQQQQQYPPYGASTSQGYYQPQPQQPQQHYQQQPNPAGYYQPQQQRPPAPFATTTVTGANYGVARPTQPASVPGATVGFQASSAGQHQAPSGLFSSLLGKKK